MASANPATAVPAADLIEARPWVVGPIDARFPGKWEAVMHDSVVRLAPFFRPADADVKASVEASHDNLVDVAAARTVSILARRRAAGLLG